MKITVKVIRTRFPCSGLLDSLRNLFFFHFFIFRYRCCDNHFPGFGKYIFCQLQTCTALVSSADYTKGSCSSNIVIFNNFLVFNFLFLISYNNFLFPFVLPYQLNAFEIPKMNQNNHRSFMILVNDANYIHLFPIFHTFQSFSYCKYKPFINSFIIFSKRMINIVYNFY